MLVALLDRVPARPRGNRARDEALDVRALGARVIRRDPVGVVRRARELHRGRLNLRLETPVGRELKSVAVEIHVAVVRVRAKLHVRGVADTAFEPLGPRFDHGDVHRRVLRILRLRVDLRLHAREIARSVQPSHIPVQLGLAVRFAGRDRAEIADHRRIVFPEPRDLELAEAESRSAGELDHEVRAILGGVDRGFAPHHARRRIGTGRERGERALLGDRPGGLPEDLALGQRPLAGEPCDRVGSERRVRGRGTRHDDAHGRDARRRPDVHGERHRHRTDVAIDPDVDLRREVAFGGGDVARFLRRLPREPIEEVVGHLRIILPAHEADVARQRFLER